MELIHSELLSNSLHKYTLFHTFKHIICIRFNYSFSTYLVYNVNIIKKKVDNLTLNSYKCTNKAECKCSSHTHTQYVPIM